MPSRILRWVTALEQLVPEHIAADPGIGLSVAGGHRSDYYRGGFVCRLVHRVAAHGGRPEMGITDLLPTHVHNVYGWGHDAITTPATNDPETKPPAIESHRSFRKLPSIAR